ncbi:MAG: hypothetical protein ACRCS0_01915, partial [Albidovulum sp.]
PQLVKKRKGRSKECAADAKRIVGHLRASSPPARSTQPSILAMHSRSPHIHVITSCRQSESEDQAPAERIAGGIRLPYDEIAISIGLEFSDRAGLRAGGGASGGGISGKMKAGMGRPFPHDAARPAW